MNIPAPNLAGKVVIVAGASSGMGRATAKLLASSGANVVIAARSADKLTSLSEEITSLSGECLPVETDLTNRQSVDRLLESTASRFGQLDAVVNAVGTNIPDRSLDALSDQAWADLLETNLTSAFSITQASLPLLRQSGGGLIIHIASSAAKKPDASGVAYQASKAGLVGLAHGTMEEERAHGIRATVIFPGLTDTDMVLKRPVPTPRETLDLALQPEDIAAACLFVLSLPPRAHVPELLIYPSRL